MNRSLQWLLAGCLLVASLQAQDVPGQYIVVLSGEPAIAAVKQKGVRLAASQSAVRSAQANVRAALEANNVEVLTSVDTVLNAMVVKADDPSLLASTPGVAGVYPVRLYKRVLDRAVLLQKVPAAGDTIVGWENAGAGMKIAVIDCGIDVSHPAFNDTGFTAPSGFPRVNKDTDTAYTNNKVIVARSYDTRSSAVATDRQGHGTGVAMAAAGVRNTGARATIMGIAPKAYLGNYKVFPDGQDGAPNSYILKAIDDAVSDGMDVINLSLGGFPAERLESDTLVRAVENATRAGVIVVVAAGNAGPGLNTIGSPATAPSVVSVGSSWSDRIFSVSVWLEGMDPLVALLSDHPPSVRDLRGPMADVAAIDTNGLACSALPSGSLTGKIALIYRGSCFFEDKLNNAQRAGAIGAVVYTDAEQEAIKMAVGSAELPAVMVGYQDGVRLKERLASGTAEVVLNLTEQPLFVNPARLADFTSKGPGIGNSIKPDLLAIGTSVYTAYPTSNGQPRYALVSGTSISTPMVTGAAALLKAYRPGLSPEQYKSMLTNSAAALSTDGALPVQQAGAGLLDVSAAVRSTLAAAPSSVDFGTGGGTVDTTQVFKLTNVSTNSDTFAISVVPSADGAVPEVTPGSVDLAPGSTAEISVHLSGSSLPVRSYEGFLVVRGTQTDIAARLPYWYAVTDGTVSSINVVNQQSSAGRGSTTEFQVRALDSAGVVVDTVPTVNVVSGETARVVSVDSIDVRYPGFYQVRVRLGSELGENVFEIKAGSSTVRVTINGV